MSLDASGGSSSGVGGVSKETAQDILTSLKKIIDVSSSHFGLDSNINPGLLHPYGTLNVDEQKINFSKHIQNLRSIIQQYKRWIATEKDMNKYLTSLKEQAKYNVQVQQLKKCIADCHATGKKYWEDSNTGSKGRILLSRLQEMAEEFSREFGLYSDLDELIALITGDGHLITDTAPVSLSTSTFLVDLTVDKTGTVQDAKLTIIFAQTGEQSQDPEIDRELLALLQSGKFDKFKSHIKFLSKLDKLYSAYPKVDLQTSLKTLESNLLQIGKSQQSAEIQSSHATSGYGVISKSCKGLRLDYYIPPFESLDEVPKKGYGISLSLEEGGTLVTLPSASQLLPTSPPPDYDSSKSWIESFLSTDTNQQPVPARFVGRLKPKIPFSLSLLRQILTITSPDAMDYQDYTDSVDGCPPLQFLIIGKGQDASALECSVDVMGTVHHYVHSGPLVGGIMVARIPFTHPQQLLQILQLVRQQVIFNELVRSCFNPSHALSPNPHPSDPSKFLVEIVTEPPHTICATFLHPVTQNLICTEIKCGLGGTIDAKLHSHKPLNTSVPPDAPPCSATFATKILNACHSIPLALKYILEK